MTIPTQEIQALRNRAQEALDPLHYQQVRLHIGLERDRPVRFAAVKARTPVLWKLFLELDAAGAAYSLGLQAMRGEVAVNWNRGIAHWPAAQIVELCDAVLERRRPKCLHCDGSMPDSLACSTCAPLDEPMTVAARRDWPSAAEIIKVAQGIPEPPKLKGGLASAVGLFGFAPNGKQLDRLNAMAKRAAARIREQGTPARLKAALLALPFVDSVQVEENRTLKDVDGMPPISVRVTVGPKLQEDERRQVAEAIDGELSVGIKTCSDAGRGWCVLVGDRTIQFNEVEPRRGTERHHPPLPHRFQIEPDRQSRADPEPASGESLDFIGELASVARRPHEADADYRARLDAHIRRPMAKVGAIDGVKARTPPAFPHTHAFGAFNTMTATGDELDALAAICKVRRERFANQTAMQQGVNRCLRAAGVFNNDPKVVTIERPDLVSVSAMGAYLDAWDKRGDLDDRPPVVMGGNDELLLVTASGWYILSTPVEQSVDFGTEPDGPTVSTFEMTEDGPVLTGVREATPDEVAEMKATFESAEPDGRIHYTDEPPRALKEAMDEAVSAEIERQRATIKDRPKKRAAFRAKLQRINEAGHRPGQEPTEAERRERLRREMTKGRW